MCQGGCHCKSEGPDVNPQKEGPSPSWKVDPEHLDMALWCLETLSRVNGILSQLRLEEGDNPDVNSDDAVANAVHALRSEISNSYPH